MVCVNLVLLRKLCKKTRCFLEKFTQLAQIITQPTVAMAVRNLNSGIRILRLINSHWWSGKYFI